MSSEAVYHELIEKLDAFIRKYYTNQIVRGGLVFLALLFTAYLCVNTLEYFGHFSTIVRGVLFYSLLGGAAYFLVRWVIIPLMHLNRLGKVISHEEASQIIGTHFPHVSDKLLNTLQLQKQVSEVKGEPSLLLAGIAQKSAELKPVPFADAIDINANKRYLRYLLPPFLLILLLLFVAPNFLQGPTQRLVHYEEHFATPAPFTFKIDNDKLQAPKNSDYTLHVSTLGSVKPDAIYIRDSGADYKMLLQPDGSFTYKFKQIQADHKFVLHSGKVSSSDYTLKALPVPVLLGFKASLKYPAYLHKKDETILNTGNLEVPEGTRITWHFSTENTDNLNLTFPDTTIRLNPAGVNVASFSKVALKSENYSVSTSNKFVGENDSISYHLTAIPDAYPAIKVDEAIDSVDSQKRYFNGQAHDDYGLTKLQFHYVVTLPADSSQGSSQKEYNQKVSFSSDEAATSFFYYWDIGQLNLPPGASISYYFVVWDNDGINGPKSTRSATQTYKAPTLQELESKRNNSQDDMEKRLKKSLEDVNVLNKKVQELNRDIVDKKQLGWQDRQRLQDILNQHDQIQKQTEQLQRQNEQISRQEEHFNKNDQQLQKQQEDMQKMFDQIMSPDMKKMYDELKKLLDQLNKDKLQDQLQKISMNNENMKKQMERTMELFKRMRVEQKMKDAIDALKKMADEQQKLSEETKNKDKENQDLLKDQKDLTQKFDSLQNQLDSLNKQNEKLEQPMKMPDTGQEQEQTQEQMQQSSQQIQKDQNQKASQSQQNASQKMKRMAQKMQSAMASNQAQQVELDMAALRSLLDNIIHLSVEQESLMETLKGTENNDPKYRLLAEKQRELRDDSKMVEDSLFALSKRVEQLQSAVNKEIGLVNDNMNKAIDAMSDRHTGQATNRQQYAMTSFNNLALMLDEVLQQMQMKLASMMPGTGNCEKPGGMGSKPSASEIRKQQEGMAKKLQALQEQLGKKGGPKGKTGMGGQMSEQLAKLAAEQAAIREAVEKLSEQLNEQGNGAGNDLKRIAQEMNQNEKDMVNKKIDQQTLNRQKDIQVRLLQHEKAEREQEYDNKRQAETAKDYPTSNPKDFLEYKKKQEREVELLRTIPANLKPYYKDRVNEYFSKFDQ